MAAWKACQAASGLAAPRTAPWMTRAWAGRKRVSALLRRMARKCSKESPPRPSRALVGGHAGHPDGAEGMDLRAKTGNAAVRAGFAEDRVVEGERFGTNLIGKGRLGGDQGHADGAHAGFGHVPERFQHAAGIGAVPLEEGEMQADVSVELDVQDLAAGTAQHGRGLGVNLGQRGRWILDFKF